MNNQSNQNQMMNEKTSDAKKESPVKKAESFLMTYKWHIILILFILLLCYLYYDKIFYGQNKTDKLVLEPIITGTDDFRESIGGFSDIQKFFN